MSKTPSIDLGSAKFSDIPAARVIADELVQGGASPRDVGAFMGFLDNLDLGPAKATADAPFSDQKPATFRARLRAEKKAQRDALAGFTTKQLKDELLERNVTDFSRITPWLKCALLLVICAAVVLTNIAVRCQDGELYGFACTIAQ
jgi:hypothetical protein